MKTFTYSPVTGMHIRDVIQEALIISNRKGVVVEFSFNGITLAVYAKVDTIKSLLDKWRSLCYQRSAAYKASPEYKHAEQTRIERISAKQEKLNNLVPLLTIGSSNVELLKWLKEFTELVDHVGVGYDRNYVLDTLYKLGFEDNMWVGYDGVWTTAHKIEYLVGQVINCIIKVGVPHPITVDWCNKLLAEEV